jgi:Ni,Fe-hydrogenase III large subunit
MRLILRDVDLPAWSEAARTLADGDADLVSLWADEGRVRMALGRPETGGLEIVSLACPDGRFPSVGAVHAPAIRLERAACDLYGLNATGALDDRPWLDHGRWPVSAPLGAATPHDGKGAAYKFLAAEGDGLHQIPVGPVHAGIIEPGHFRFHASGEAVVRLEQRLGYKHKGVDALFRGAEIDKAAVLAGRISGDSAVAYAFAFALAVESALGVTPPPRAAKLRGVMAELERVANHIGDIGAICNDASFALLQAHGSTWRERALRASEAAFGHRLMMDAIVPGGLVRDIAPQGAAAIGDFTKALRAGLPRMVKLYDDTASLQDRTVRTGLLSKALVRQFAAGGCVGRASGRNFDARREYPYAPYDGLGFSVVTHADGDVNARVWLRFGEIEQSLDLIDALLARLPEGKTLERLSAVAEPREGFALTEGFRGEVFAAVRLGAGGNVARAHFRDPSWFQWPLLEAAIEGNIVADFPLCNKSFNGSYSGVDL